MFKVLGHGNGREGTEDKEDREKEGKKKMSENGMTRTKRILVTGVDVFDFVDKGTGEKVFGRKLNYLEARPAGDKGNGFVSAETSFMNEKAQMVAGVTPGYYDAKIEYVEGKGNKLYGRIVDLRKVADFKAEL